MSLDRINAVLGKYRLLWYVLMAVLLAAGFDWTTPAAQFRTNLVRDSVLAWRHDSLLTAVREGELINRGQARYTCLKDPLNARMAGLPCAVLGVSIR